MPEERTVHADPTKDYFVFMITKDIPLEDCILDLLDNCLDGARRVLQLRQPGHIINDYTGFRARLRFSNGVFQITDNCGGISLQKAIDHAFHFGRRRDAPDEGEFSIGLYGIGMKRAIFKLGKEISVHSTTDAEAFKVSIDVDEWLARDDWDFDLDDADRLPDVGTEITVRRLYPQIGEELALAVFQTELIRQIARDYSQYIAKGFEIYVNDARVTRYPFSLRESEEFRPVRVGYQDEGIEVEIIAGMAGLPPDGLEPDERFAETDYYGWFVNCNDRVVLAADKTDETVWGVDGFPVWHYQYNGFIGVITFHAREAADLPWTTTKRGMDQNSPIYRRAKVKMREVTRAWIDYTKDRRADLEAAKEKERAAEAKPLFSVEVRQAISLPRLVARPQEAVATISYQRPKAEIKSVARALGNANLSNRDVGIKTYEYFIRHEVSDEGQ